MTNMAKPLNKSFAYQFDFLTGRNRDLSAQNTERSVVIIEGLSYHSTVLSVLGINLTRYSFKEITLRYFNLKSN